jgi:hypothetical protein
MVRYTTLDEQVGVVDIHSTSLTATEHIAHHRATVLCGIHYTHAPLGKGLAPRRVIRRVSTLANIVTQGYCVNRRTYYNI